MFKRIILFLFIFLLLFSINLFADDDLFKTFQLSYVFLDQIDIFSTLHGIRSGKLEANPLAKWYIKKPALTIAVHFVLNISIIKITDILFEKNKKLGWIVLIGLNVIKAYVVYRNFKIIGWL